MNHERHEQMGREPMHVHVPVVREGSQSVVLLFVYGGDTFLRQITNVALACFYPGRGNWLEGACLSWLTCLIFFQNMETGACAAICFDAARDRKSVV